MYDIILSPKSFNLKKYIFLSEKKNFKPRILKKQKKQKKMEGKEVNRHDFEEI